MPEPILVLSHLEAVHLADSHRDVHVSFDIFSTELQRLETTKLCLPNWNYSCVYPDENCEDHNKYEDEAERLVQQHQQPEQLLPHQQPQQQQRCPHYHRGVCSALQHQMQAYRSYMAKRTAEERFWESVGSRDWLHPASDSDDTVSAEKDYNLESGQDKGFTRPFARLRRVCQVFQPGGRRIATKK
ncbi:uncharacterized protein ZBIST_3163 [Zygosaccharomyces bailii]|nr:uncharacterized protein ZBAI_02787 [Zygosaccharomyces bailii ISA1307]SJM86974.1 uncharacterized protein ZBIST_3163 [Zygosaccharomyces bailii]